ncbi:MAG: TIGR00730 family Rossman fold protein [Elusimicrobiota bacterium]|jgi:uncharacterized protein (TIGR00730 family)|nr:TIGR00730 family Rossman fold protein [Elusimicrobiota bacterium]
MAKNIPNSYLRAYEDIGFLKSNEARSVRVQLELLKPDVILKKHRITQGIVCFGSARVCEQKPALERVKNIEAQLKQNPSDKKLREKLKEAKGLLSLSKYYDEARKFGELAIKKGRKQYAIVTGGGPGIMEAANRGAFEAGGKSIGMNITLPMEQEPNPYITKGLAFLFHYFAIRKMHLVMRSRAIVVFPGGYGTMDEMFETLTLVQTGKKDNIPVILVGKKFWNDIFNFGKLANYGVISHEDKYHLVETAQEAWDIIAGKYKIK